MESFEELVLTNEEMSFAAIQKLTYHEKFRAVADKATAKVSSILAARALKAKQEAVEQARKDERRKLADQLMFEEEDVTVFDTSYGYNQVKISPIFLNEDSDLWQTIQSLKSEGG